MIRCLTVSLLLALAPLPAAAQTCPDPLPIACGDQVSGDTLGFNIPDNSCLDYSWGYESYYLLSLDQPAEITARVVPNNEPFTAWDAVLYILPESGGDCVPMDCIVGVDDHGSGSPEALTTVLWPGVYYLVIDGVIDWDGGDFDLSLDCSVCDNCTDGDGDGYPGYDANGCICGNDCDDDNELIHPGALEICGDGVDQDCSGGDDACPACDADLVLDCGDSGTASPADGEAQVDRYCNHDESRWTAREYIFGFTPVADTTVDFNMSWFNFIDQMDAFALMNFGVSGVCNPNACLDFGLETSGVQHLAFYAQAGQEYFISVDGRDSSQISFDYTIACNDESCVSNDIIACGDSVNGNNTSGATNVNAYQGMSWHALGPEYVYTFSPPADLWVTMELTVTAGLDVPDLALVVVEDDGNGACLPGETLVFSDVVQDTSSNPPEQVGFQAAASATYYVIVDGWRSSDAGPYQLEVGCQVECGLGEVECDFQCVDTSSDPFHCGGCGIACNYNYAEALCVGGSCVMGECQDNHDDCDDDPNNGCEIPLGTLQDCGACGDACQFDHAPASCEDMTCVMGECNANWADCNSDTADGCETNLTTLENCGSCGNSCPGGQFCYDGGCVSECPGGLTDCDGTCTDTNSDLSNCGGCGSVCSVVNGTAACVQGECQVESCDDGFGDCNQEAGDGCEAALGTNQNCSACGDTCQYPHAPGSCEEGVCQMGACEMGFGDCNEDDADGCEAELRSDDDNCGSCGNACQEFYRCQYGQCQFSCEDEDGDGHEPEGCGGDDCDDGDASVYPGAEEICGDGTDQDCDGVDPECQCTDEDGDGYDDAACGGDDCDDSNGFIYPGATETCGDGVDQDCDGLDLTCNCPDADGDGFPSAACGGSDCDDSNHFTHPGAAEACGDGVDQDCDGADLACEGCGCSHHGNSRSALTVVLAMGLLWRRRKKRPIS